MAVYVFCVQRQINDDLTVDVSVGDFKKLESYSYGGDNNNPVEYHHARMKLVGEDSEWSKNVREHIDEDGRNVYMIFMRARFSMNVTVHKITSDMEDLNRNIIEDLIKSKDLTELGRFLKESEV